MVYAEVLYDVATIRKIQGFYLKDPPVASCRCFFLCLFGAELFWQKILGIPPVLVSLY